MNNKVAGTASALFLSMLVAGCGGGGGDSEVANLFDTRPGMVASSVTSDNAESMAAQGYAALSTLGDQEALGNQFVTGVSLSSGQVNPIDASLALLYKKSGTVGNLVVGATVTENCTNGGSVTFTDTATSLSIAANNCREDSMLMHGAVSFVFSNMTGTPDTDSAWGATMVLSYQDLSITDSGTGLRISGDMTVDYSQTSSQVINVSASGQSLHMRYLENGAIVLNSLLQPYSFTMAKNFNTNTNSADFTYASSGSGIGATSYTVDTTTPFQSTGAAYPHAGSLTVIATNNSMLTLTALSSTNVRLALDLDGNTQIDETIDTTWVALESQL